MGNWDPYEKNVKGAEWKLRDQLQVSQQTRGELKCVSS